MKHIFNFLLVMLLLAGVNSIYAATAADELSALLESVRYMRADFTQTVYDNHGQVVQQSNGRMALLRPGRFKWEVIKPIPQLVIANNEKLWIYDRDLAQVTVKKLQQQTGETPALLLSHKDASLNQDYTVKMMKNHQAGAQWFSLAPKDENSMFASIQIGFINKKIYEMHLEDRLGHQTVIKFSNINDQSFGPSLFVFKPPKNVDVIDENQKK